MIQPDSGQVFPFLFNGQVLVREAGKLSLLSIGSQEEKMVNQMVGEAGEVGRRDMS